MSSIASDQSTISGTQLADIIAAYNSGSSAANVIDAGDGNDIVFGDTGPVFVDADNNYGLSAAMAIGAADHWSTFADPMIGSPSTPHTTVIAQHSQTGQDWFSFSATSGSTITLDLDLANTPYTDVEMTLYRTDGVLVALSHNEFDISKGGLGSFNADPFIDYVAATTGTYYIAVSLYHEASLPVGITYALNISNTGHAATAATVEGDDTLSGGNGNDYLIGAGGTDTINGDAGNDYLSGDAGNDTLNSGTGFDQLFGGTGNDTLDGGADADLLEGGSGNDILHGGMGADGLEGGAGNDLLDGGDETDTADYSSDAAGVTVKLYVTTAQDTGGSGTDMLTAIENITGSRFDDTLIGDEGNNILRGGMGADHLSGRGGDDRMTWQNGEGNDNFSGGDGTDLLDLSASFFIDFDVDLTAGKIAASTGETITFNSIEQVFTAFGNDIVHSVGNAYIDTDGGNDTIYASLSAGEFVAAGAEIDTLYANKDGVALAINLVSGISSTGGTYYGIDNIFTGNLADTVIGNDTENIVRTGAGDDNVQAGAGRDLIEAGDGDDYIDGGADIDTASYEHATAGVTVSLLTVAQQDTGGAGKDTITNIEYLTGSAFADMLTGNDDQNIFESGAGNDTITGNGGDDFLNWHEGDGTDIFYGGTGSDIIQMTDAVYGWYVDLAGGVAIQDTPFTPTTPTIYFESVERFTATDQHDTIFSKGGARVDAWGGDDLVIASADGNDMLFGGSGINTLDTSSYNVTSFTYIIDLAAGTTNRGQMIANFQNLFSGDTNDNVTGTAANNAIHTRGGTDVITAGGGDDIVDAGVGTNTIYGESGIDTVSYASAQSGVVVSLALQNTQQSVGDGRIDYLDGIENLTGSAYDDILAGDDGANMLTGLAGSDTLDGGLGDDRYYVDNALDDVIEANDAGNDRIYASVSYALTGRVVETMQLTGTAAIDATGNGRTNTLIGNESSNILSGLEGNDVLSGRGGDDLLIGGTGNDTLNGGDGTDTASYAGAAAAVTVSLATTAAQNTGSGGVDTLSQVERLFGSAFSDHLTGDAGVNKLDGGAGADVLMGGLGNDLYIVDNVNDNVVEASNAGADRIVSTVTYSLSGRFVETLDLAGTLNINATGNGQANSLTGNGANNRLSGLEGDDTLSGGAGNDALNGGEGLDRLTGGGGHDQFYFTTAPGADNLDRIADFSVADDIIMLGASVFAGLSAGALNPNAFYVGAAANDASDRIFYNDATGALWFDPDGTGAGAATFFVRLGTGLSLTSADFVVV